MIRYRYKVINEEGRYIKGKMSAENPSDLTTILRNSGLELISFSEEKQSALDVSFLNKVKPRDLITMFVHLEQLDRAGVSIIDSISDLKDTADSLRIKNLAHEIYESVKNGNLFSETLAKRPDIFSHTYIGLVAMGEKTGNLASSFASIVDDLKWTIDIKRKTKKATNGPLFGLFMVVVVMAVMTSIVVPKVTGFLKSQQLKLPGTTIALMNFSDFFQNYWYLVILTPVAIFIAIKIMQRSEHLAIKIDHLKLKIPVIGGISNKIDAAKFCQFFSMTFKSGLGVLECLDASSFAINNKAIRYSIIDVKHQVSDGKSLAKALASSGYFPVLVLRMFKVGEDTGNMEGALDNIKFFYDREINDSIDRLVAMIQPTLTIIMGGMIAWITIAVFGPVYGTFSQIR